MINIHQFLNSVPSTEREGRRERDRKRVKKIENIKSEAWYLISVISASWKQRQEDHYKVEANLVCLAKVRQPELQNEVLVQLTVSLLRAYG